MLGIDWIKILIHLVVFAVLGVGLYFLLYKPVLRFIRNRQESIQKGIDDGNALKEEGNALKAEYDQKLSAIEEERNAVIAEAETQKQEILDAAKESAARESEAIKHRARQEADAAKQQAVQDMQKDAGKVATLIAGEILHREISAEENDQIILDCLKAWSEND